MDEFSYEAACEKLNGIGEFLTVSDFADMVYVKTHDSIQIYGSALAKRFGPWVLLWTEHNGYQVLHVEDLTTFIVYPAGSIGGFQIARYSDEPEGSRSIDEIDRLVGE